MPSTSSSQHHHQRPRQQDKQQRTPASHRRTYRQSTIEQYSTPKRKTRTSCAAPINSHKKSPTGQSRKAVKKLAYFSPHGAETHGSKEGSPGSPYFVEYSHDKSDVSDSDDDSSFDWARGLQDADDVSHVPDQNNNDEASGDEYGSDNDITAEENHRRSSKLQHSARPSPDARSKAASNTPNTDINSLMGYLRFATDSDSIEFSSQSQNLGNDADETRSPGPSSDHRHDSDEEDIDDSCEKECPSVENLDLDDSNRVGNGTGYGDDDLVDDEEEEEYFEEGAVNTNTSESERAKTDDENRSRENSYQPHSNDKDMKKIYKKQSKDNEIQNKKEQTRKYRSDSSRRQSETNTPVQREPRQPRQIHNRDPSADPRRNYGRSPRDVLSMPVTGFDFEEHLQPVPRRSRNEQSSSRQQRPNHHEPHDCTGEELSTTTSRKNRETVNRITPRPNKKAITVR